MIFVGTHLLIFRIYIENAPYCILFTIYQQDEQKTHQPYISDGEGLCTRRMCVGYMTEVYATSYVLDKKERAQRR